jgi:catechol 2,3-dioxygenase-like lactoylglutathione lyase family enzyme
MADPTSRPARPIGRILESALYVGDMQRAREFYVDLLGFAPLLDSARLLALSVSGTSVLLLFQSGATEEPLHTPGGVVPPHGAAGEQHLAFAISADSLDEWESRFADAGVRIESRVTWPRGGVSLYVRDPDGHSLELATPGVWEIY